MEKVAACPALWRKPIGEEEREIKFSKDEKIKSKFDLFWQKLKDFLKAGKELRGKAYS
jgi:hypothetical protein